VLSFPGGQLRLGPGDIQHFIDDPGQALCVLPDHGGELAMARVLQVFFEQALACEMAASGFLISWATAADMRPMAAIFSVRTRASISRRSSRNMTQRLSCVPFCEAASRVRT
jgi:hypothetical protein